MSLPTQARRTRAGAAAIFACLLPVTGCSSSSAGSSAETSEAGATNPPGKIYVTIYGEDEITVIDQATRAIVAHIPVGKGPAILLATPDNKKLYAANWSDNTISAVDVATSAVKSIALDGRPWAIAMSPAGNKLYAGVGSNKLAVVDTTSDTVATTFDTSPNFPESVVASHDGSQVYVDPGSTSDFSSLGSGTLESLSASDGSVVHAPITVGATPAWASIAPDGTRVYTLNFLAGTVSVVDTGSWSVLATVSTGSGSQPIISASTADGLLVVTDFGAGNAKTIDFASNKVVHTVALDGRPVGVGGFNADGTLGYICDFGHASLAVQETLTLSLDFLNGNLSPFVGNGPGNVTAFNPATGEKIGKSIAVGKGPTSVVVIAP
jgi:YVTN family beta-propeller protein